MTTIELITAGNPGGLEITEHAIGRCIGGALTGKDPYLGDINLVIKIYRTAASGPSLAAAITEVVVASRSAASRGYDHVSDVFPDYRSDAASLAHREFGVLCPG